MKNELILKQNDKLPILKGGLSGFKPRKSQQDITIKKLALPENDSFDESFAWISASLGFFESIDKNRVACMIFKEIFIATTMGQVLTSTAIAERIGMSRGATIHQLNNLKKAGLIEKGGKYYFTRHKTMVGILEELEDDLLHIFTRMKKIGKELDKETSKVINLH